MQKLIIVLTLLLFSCSSIDYNVEPEKQFIDDGSLQICTKRILYYYNNYDHFGINDKIQKYFILDSTNKVYLKDLPRIWPNLGFNVVLFENFDDKTWSSIEENNIWYIVIYKKSNMFSSKLHASKLLAFSAWKDGSFRLEIDDPESGDDEIIGIPDSNNKQFIQIWALSKIDNNSLKDSSSYNKE
jgi:hypothetical protein